jgi:DNA-binding response OmpR family regulator
LRTLLDLEGDQAITVSRPEDIVRTARLERPNLILLDLHLTGGDSRSALRELKNDPELKTIPVLMTSGMDKEQECLKEGADAFIMKPFRPAELITRLHKLIK